MPPALVEMLPPIWQVPSAPRLNGKRRLTSAALRWISCSTTPASTVMVSFARSIPRIAFMRAVETITSFIPVPGWLP